eukprot:CAMPEP_0176438058 /NCGR_PEP_ID=MMETSP0127-20121128/19039_1 /TAXON_ID=938130 /ORGANISM="Platyophrya macrostoma, Strain WH" /LENGTH=234 /DNA_ID=CAMNT_0017821899 /DNA_START=32 /DNA_END=736 /DNA_ORIENTATION=+
MIQREIEKSNEAFFKDNTKDIGTIKFIPKSKAISVNLRTGAGPESSAEYNLELMSNDKPTILFTETEVPKSIDSDSKKNDVELDLIDFIKFKGNALKGQNEKIEYKISSEPIKRTQKYDQREIRGRHNNEALTDNDWARRERATREIRREKQDKDVLEAKIFELFKQKPKYKFTEIQAETGEPKNSLDEALKSLCDTETLEGRKFYVLKEIYRFGGGGDQSYSGSTPTKKVKKD